MRGLEETKMLHNIGMQFNLLKAMWLNYSFSQS
jgi:hypothetical protein